MIHISNWEKYQSYKDRKPPWIRFHRSILDDYQFQKMSAEARAMLPMFWLLACEYDDPTAGLIKYSEEEIAFRLRQDKRKILSVINELQVSGFIACNESVTNPYPDRKKTVTPETETETETDIYGTFGNVKLTEKEFSKIKEQFTDYEDRINRLSEYMKSKGKRYKSHYATILSWARKDKNTNPAESEWI